MTAGDFKQSANLNGKVLASGQIPGSFLLSFTGSPTGGTFTPTVTVGGVAVAASAQTYSSGYTAASLQTALQGLSNVGSSNATVTGSNGGPFTITFAATLAPVTLTAASALTGGTVPAAPVTAPAVTLYTVPASSAVKVASAYLTNLSNASVPVTVFLVPSGGSVDVTHQALAAYPLAAGDTISQEDVLALLKGAMLDTGAVLAVSAPVVNGINYAFTGAVSN